MNKNKPIIIDYSLEGTDITHEVNVDGYLIVKSKGMTIKSAEKVTEKTNLNALALAMVSEAKETLKREGIDVDLLAYAEEIILSMGGNGADVEQIIEEIKESGYTTIEEVKSHLENYYM